MPDFMTPPIDALIAPSGPVWLHESGIMITVNTTPVQTGQDAIDNMVVTRRAGGGIPRPLLVDITRVKEMTREAREEYVKPESLEIITSVALITRSNVGAMVGNLFINLNRHIVPIKLFTDPHKAKDWLLTHRTK